jgi:hypothetical protein
LAAGATLAMGGVADAACTCTVDSIMDPTEGGHTTLRDAIISANANAGPDTISFASGLSGQITLANDLPTITQALDIQGPGADQITISGNDANRIFDLDPTPGDPVSISGLTLTGGSAASSSTAALRGGAILNETAHLTVSDSTISGNTGPSYGGGIYSGYPSSPTTGYLADLTVRRSTLSGNHTSQGGGAIYFNHGSGHIADSTITGNSAFWGGGLGIYYMQGPTVIENSTISGNTATGSTPDRGGGLYIFRNPAGVTLSSATVSGNTAEEGGGVFDYGYIPLSGPSNQPPVLHNTIVAGNTATGFGPDVSNDNGSSFNSAFSLIQDTSTGTVNETVAGSDITGQDPQLSALGSNGGATQTMVPVGTSPAIDQGSAFGLATDQRGLTRPIELAGFPNSSAAGADGSDIGAVELQSPPEPSPAEPSPPAALSPPSNAFTHGKPKLNRKKGTATIAVKVPGAGTLTLSGKNLVTQRPAGRPFARRARTVSGAGTVKLTIKSKGTAKKKLNKTGKVKVKPKITFTPTGGSAASQSLNVTLKKTTRK